MTYKIKDASTVTIVTRDISYWGGWIYSRWLIELFISDWYNVNLVWPENPFWDKVNFFYVPTFGAYFVTKELFFFFYARIIIHINNLWNTLILNQHNLFSYWLYNVISFRHMSHSWMITWLKHEPWSFKKIVWLIFHFLYMSLDDLTIIHAKKVIFISQETCKSWLKRYWRYRSKFYHIPNFINFDSIRLDINDWLDTSKNNHRIIFVWRLEYAKGILDLCNVLYENYETLTNIIWEFSLEIIWDWYLKSKLIWYPFVVYSWKLEHAETIKKIASSDLLILPSYYENFPTVILEWMVTWILVLSRIVWDIDEILWNECEKFKNNSELISKIIHLLTLNKEEKTELLLSNQKKVSKYRKEDVFSEIKHLIYK